MATGGHFGNGVNLMDRPHENFSVMDLRSFVFVCIFREGPCENAPIVLVRSNLGNVL